MIQNRTAYKNLYIKALILYIICLPLNAMNIGAIGSALKLVAILPVGIALIFGGKLNKSVPLMAQLVFTFFAGFSLIWTKDLDSSFGRLLSYVLLFAVIASSAAFNYSEQDALKIKKALAWSSRITAVIMFIFAEYVGERLTLNGIIQEDPNYLSVYVMFGIAYSLGVLTTKNKKSRKIIAILEILVYFFLVLATGSRGGLLAVGSGVILYLLTYTKNSAKQLFKKVALIGLVVVAFLLIIDKLPESIKERFTIKEVEESGGTGRMELWMQTLDLFANGDTFRKFFGYGTASIVSCFTMFNYPVLKVTHNMFLETLAELGVIGFIMYSVAIFSFIKTAFSYKDKFAFAVIICMFVLSLSTSIYTFKPYFNIMLYIIFLLNVKPNKKEKNEQEEIEAQIGEENEY